MSGEAPPESTIEGGVLYGGAHTALRARREAAEELPPPSEKWLRSEVPAVLDESLQKFRQLGIVQVVDGKQVGSNRYNIYRTAPAAARYVDHLPEPGSPCDHTGIRNLGGGEYTCGNERCAVRFDKATAEAALEEQS